MKKVLLLLLILLIFCGCNKNKIVDNSNEDQIVEEHHEEKTEDVSNKEQNIEEHNEEKVKDDSYTFVNIDTAINEHECQYSFDYILNNYGEKYYPAKPNVYVKGKQNVQDAHEAIRPSYP